MTQILQNLKTGEMKVAELPCPQVGRGSGPDPDKGVFALHRDRTNACGVQQCEADF